MKHRIPVSYVVTAYRNNLQVASQQATELDAAERIATRMRAVPGTTVEVNEVPDPNETDLTTLSRELSESRGWRPTPVHDCAKGGA